MNSAPHVRVGLAVVLPFAVLLAACAAPYPIEPLPPPPPVPVPDPIPNPEPIPEPNPGLPDRSAFAEVAVGMDAGVLDTLPRPDRTVDVGVGLIIYVWVLREPRPEGGQVMWEVHVENDVVTASFAL